MARKSRNQRRKEAAAKRRTTQSVVLADLPIVETKEIRPVRTAVGVRDGVLQIIHPDDVVMGTVEKEIASTPASSAPSPPSELDPISRLAIAMQTLAETVQAGFQEMNQRIATVEQAQQEGLLTLSTQSGLSVAGLSGQDTGPSQGQLTQTREFSELRRAEMAILAEESNDLPAPTDERMVIVGAVTEAEVERRRRMLEEIMSRGGMGY